MSTEIKQAAAIVAQTIVCIQTGPETWQDQPKTLIIQPSTTVEQIIEWWEKVHGAENCHFTGVVTLSSADSAGPQP